MLSSASEALKTYCIMSKCQLLFGFSLQIREMLERAGVLSYNSVERHKAEVLVSTKSVGCNNGYLVLSPSDSGWSSCRER
jgi:hypothetical protein